MTAQKKGILAVAGSSIAIFWVGAFVFAFPGVMASQWQEALQAGRGAIGNTLFFVLASLGVFMYPVGRWQEKFGVRRMVTVGALICGLDILLIAHVPNLFVLYLWAFLMGTASCFIYLPGITTVQRWFPGRLGLVSGIVNFMFGFSGAVMSPMFGFMLHTMGYFSMTVVLGLIALVVGIGAAQFTELPQAPQDSARMGQPGRQKPSMELIPSLSLREAILTRSFWFLWLTWALQGAAGIAMVILSAHFGLSLGFTLKSAVVILTAFNVTNGLSRLLMGYLSDLVGRNLTMSATFLAAGAAYFVLPYASGLMTASLLAAIIGFAFGTLFAVSAPLAIECFGPLHFGAVYGLTFTAYGFVAGPLGPSLSGYVLDATGGNFVAVFSYLGVFCVISGILILFVVRPRVH